VDSSAVGQLRECSLKTTGIVWESSSAAFATVASSKPLDILFGEDTIEEMEATAFWLAKLPGVTDHPPTGAIHVISIGRLRCEELMTAVLTRIFKLGLQNTATAAKWRSRSADFTCREAAAESLDVRAGRRVALPFWTAKRLKGIGYTDDEMHFTADLRQLNEAGFSAASLKDAGFDVRQLKQAGFGASPLREAGFSATELKEAEGAHM